MEKLLSGKKFYIGVDCEGVACVVGEPGKGLGTGELYRFATKEATREANAVAEALFELGADESFAGVMFIGYHARENTVNGVLAHTYSSEAYQYFKLNGQEVGEMQIDAAFAALKDVPVILCVSDYCAIEQAKESFPWAETVVTKKGLSWTSAVSKHPQAVCEEIRAAVNRAAQRLEEMKCRRLLSPLEVEIRYKKMEDASEAKLMDQNGKPFARTDAFTRKGIMNSIEDLF